MDKVSGTNGALYLPDMFAVDLERVDGVDSGIGESVCIGGLT